MTFTGPGLYPHMTDTEYFADPVPGWGSLSNSEAKTLLDKTPQAFKYARDNGVREFKSEYDFGHVGHALILGKGSDIVVINADNWRKKADQEARDEARAAGKAPILVAEYERAKAMADAFFAHPIAPRLIDGQHEVAGFWMDGPVCRRCKFDTLPEHDPKKRYIVADYKTADDASEAAFQRQAANFRYHRQDAWYLDGIRALIGPTDPAFVFIVQERNPPYLINIIELDPMFRKIGEAQNRAAIELFQRCNETGEWPGYGHDIKQVIAPRWLEIEFENNYLEEYPSW